MIHSEVIVTLVAAFVAAFAGGLVASRFGLPPIVGYLAAGIVIGPNTPFGSADTSLASEFAEVGVILLMFGVGLHFSLKELIAVAPIAVPGAVGHRIAVTLMGLGVAQLWGWSLTEGLIFGLCLAVASTVVLLRALEERNLIETVHGHVAVGWLIVEDLFTVLILVLLPVLAPAGGDGSGLASHIAGDSAALQIGLSLGQAALFVVLMLFVGVKAIPFLLHEVVRSGSRELFTLCILALALGVAFGSAELFGASLALGAFLAGVVLNESELSHRAGLEALPMRDAFAVLFFVSVGMLFEPSILVDEPLHVLGIVAIIVAGKSLAALLIVAGIGYGVRTALIVSAALSQIGEFSFILAALAISLDLLPQEATSLILAGSIISITLNPFVFRNVDRLERVLRRWPWFTDVADRNQPEPVAAPSLRRHVVICGYGGAGSSLARALNGRQLPFVIVENNPFVYERARLAGLPVVFGDATQPVVLDQAQIGDSRTLAVTFGTLPDAELTVQNAKHLNPNLDVVARADDAESYALLRESGTNEIIDAGFEVSSEFVRHVLHRYGIDAREIAALQARWRAEHYGFE